MAKLIGLFGESGAGKTTSLRGLDPKTTFIVDADKKGLSWKGWREQYSPEKMNYWKCDDNVMILEGLKKLNAARPDLKVIVIDTINGIMIADEMKRSKEKGYDKWIDLATAVYDIIDTALMMRDDLTVVFVAHAQTVLEDTGYMFTRMKTSGKKLDKIVLESKFPTVLLAKAVAGNYVFETHANNSTAKTPLGAFDTDTIPNDLAAVIKVLEEY